MSPLLALFLVLLLGATSYAAGRLHGQLSYRVGYRFGYRQGYFDGDRGAWNRRRREAQAVLASALAVPVAPPPAGLCAPVPPRPAAGPAVRQGTTYTGSSFAAVPGPATGGQHPAGTLVRRPG
ncbi:hypothetical protein [Micromonospora sp. WMMD987]|uniref:hypothetical protein n=1 Tax=Micromonospora TaxID=1873 RepID=UPI00249B8D63|nr:hypothetical protein [Micromonospora sp. WMMD987]WFE96349.1 hypothetical protein O7612_05435 [Micromonospora sp. WMMD987]